MDARAARPAPPWSPWMLALWVLFLGRLLLLAGRGELPLWARRIHARPLGDDLAHLLVAAVTAGLLELCCGSRRLRLGSGRLPLGASLAFLLLTLEELSQGFLPTRVLSPMDLGASWLGIGLGWLLVRALARPVLEQPRPA